MARNAQQNLAQAQQTEVTRREKKEMETQREYFLPTVDVSETADALVLRYDMPGVKKENAEITVDGGTLTVTGKAEPEESGTVIYRETRIGDYQRQFALPEDVDASQITAEMNMGVLTVTIKKPEEYKPKKIQITGG
jgi:HSP20 family protein